MLTDRRIFLSIITGLLVTPARAQAPAMSRITAFAFHFAGLKGGDIQLAEYAGKPILIVNTASQCGYTPQYAGLQELWTRFRDRGLLVVGVPSNDFGGQEPGGPDEIARTANEHFGASFPLAAKAEVRGANPHPFYKWAAFERPFELPSWNFHKYLIGRDGHVVATFPAEVEKRRHHVPVTADQVLVEVPARQLERALEGRPFVERMRVGAPHLRLGGERKRGTEMLVRGPGDLVGAARLLPAEIVRRYADDQKAAVAKARPQFLQAG